MTVSLTGSPDSAVSSSLITISPMRRRHLRGVVAIEQQASSHPWSLGLFLGELRMPTSRSYVVALDRHVVVGFSGLMYTGDEGHITNIAVQPDYRRLGIAQRMLLGTMRQASRCALVTKQLKSCIRGLVLRPVVFAISTTRTLERMR